MELLLFMAIPNACINRVYFYFSSSLNKPVYRPKRDEYLRKNSVNVLDFKLKKENILGKQGEN